MPEEYDDQLRRLEGQIADLTRLFERQSEAMRGDTSAREFPPGIVAIGIDPEGYVWLEFASDDVRLAFMTTWVPGGLVYAMQRPSSEGPPRLTFKLSDFPDPFVLRRREA